MWILTVDGMQTRRFIQSIRTVTKGLFHSRTSGVFPLKEAGTMNS